MRDRRDGEKPSFPRDTFASIKRERLSEAMGTYRTSHMARRSKFTIWLDVGGEFSLPEAKWASVGLRHEDRALLYWFDRCVISRLEHGGRQRFET